jgi:hypothetical protein
MSDEEFMAGFENGSLPDKSFHHRDHVRMAFLYLSRYPALEALQRFSAALERFAAGKGKADRYSETITWGFFLLVRERMFRSGDLPSWPEFAARNEDLLNWEDHALKNYYREETLQSDLAKRIFLFPDKTVVEP